MSVRWAVEQVEAVAPSAASVTSARPLATPARWRSLGADERVLWGSCQGSGAEPYDTMVDHVGVGFRCTCPSRRVPCKHAIALLLLWVRDQVPPATPPAGVDTWLKRRAPRSRATEADTAALPDPDDKARSSHGSGDGSATEPTDSNDPVDARTTDRAADRAADPSESTDSLDVRDAAAAASGALDADAVDATERPADNDRDSARDERVERMFAGLGELDRWLDDRIRTGLADPALARYATWDDLAARLVDAQAGSLANRIRRLAGLVGATPDWQSDVLAELGLLHLLAQAGRRLGSLPGPLADAVATTVGWQVKKADVLAGVPDTDQWVVAGRSDQREDRIEVRRHWLRGETSGRWALVLSFAAFRQSLDTSLVVGTIVHADLHRYPGPALRALVGTRHLDPAGEIFPGERPVARIGRPPATTVADACDGIGRMLVTEPWLDRLPATVTASLASHHGRWLLTDHTGSLPLLHVGDAGGHDPLAMLLSVSQGRPVDITIEWTPHGVTPLAVHLDGRSVDVGPRADASFVDAA